MGVIVERVAEAILASMKDTPCFTVQANGPNGEAQLKLVFEYVASAAITAMREPTDDMTKLAYTENATTDLAGEDDFRDHYADVWQTMIEAALK